MSRATNQFSGSTHSSSVQVQIAGSTPYWQLGHAAGAPVELVGGDDLVDLLKEYQLGVTTQLVEQVTAEKHFFDQFSRHVMIA